MINVEITENATSKAKRYQVKKKFDKQIEFLKVNPKHTSLKFQPYIAIRGVWKFRIDLHYWGLVVKPAPNTIKVYDVIKHPQ